MTQTKLKTETESMLKNVDRTLQNLNIYNFLTPKAKTEIIEIQNIMEDVKDGMDYGEKNEAIYFAIIERYNKYFNKMGGIKSQFVKIT